ncbi:unnamed protein product [Rhizopus stolonifer]
MMNKETYGLALEKLLSVLQNRSRSSYIAAAIALITVQRVYSFLRVPKSLRGFPVVPVLSIIKAYLDNLSPIDRFKRIVFPVIENENGLYVNKIPFGWRLYIANPVIAKQMLLKTDNFPKDHSIAEELGEDSFIFKFFGLDNIALSNGNMWKAQRKTMNPAFYRTPPLKVMESVVLALFSNIEAEGDNFPVTKRLHDFTLDVLGLAIFDFNFNALQGDPEGWTKTYNLVIETLLDPLFNVFPALDSVMRHIYPKRIKGIEAVIKLNAKFDELARKKRIEIQKGVYANVPDSQKDVLTLMLESEQKGESMKTDEELRHNIAILFVAGHDTTANTLSFCLYNLAKNKDIQQKLREEVISVLGDNPHSETPTLEELKKMKYMNMVIKENLRLNGPVDFLFSRKTVKEINLSGTIIPKDTAITVDLNGIHRNPKYWANPDEFIPERFLENGEQGSHEGLTWLPFSNGSRQCLGMNFSLAEQRLLLAMIGKCDELLFGSYSFFFFFWK